MNNTPRGPAGKDGPGTLSAPRRRPLVIPRPEDLTELPEALAEFLVNRGQGADYARGQDWRSGHGGGSLLALRSALQEYGGGKPCPQLQGIADRAIVNMLAGASAHESARDAVYGILQDFNQGHRGASTALRQVRTAFLSAPGPLSRRRTAVGEWQAFARGFRPSPGLGSLSDPCRALEVPVTVHGLTPERIERLQARRSRNAAR